MSNSCYIDTTVLVEALLKAKAHRLKASEAIKAFDESLLPVYAIKEFSAGALSNYLWAHDLLVDTDSFQRTVRAIHRSIHKPYRKGTAEEALLAAGESVHGRFLPGKQSVRKFDQLLAEEYRLALRRRIRKGWSDRRSIATRVVNELACFPEEEPEVDSRTRLFRKLNTRCSFENAEVKECSFAAELRRRRPQLAKLLKFIGTGTRSEDIKRRNALTKMNSHPSRLFDEADCRHLGDAYFALFCPEHSVILTSNTKDHTILAEALNKAVEKYQAP
jgi:hypothetical protein